MQLIILGLPKTYDGECVTTALMCKVTKRENNALVGIIHIPIHMLLNRYGNAAINGWDGNSVSIDKDGNGVILAPQVGAGKKEDDNSFTGILMGEVKEGGRVTKDVGLFGYANGVRTIFLDADTGMATFGKTGGGQIILDPSSNKAQIKSGDYKASIGNIAGTGMLIDLTEPSIRFGNGNFTLDKTGKLTTRNIVATGGTVGGWTITSDRLYSGTVGMAPKAGTYYAFWAGNSNSSQAPFRVGHDGKLVASAGTIGGWTIGNTSLTGGSTYLNNNGSIGGPNWSIDSGGNATFNNVRLTQGSYNRQDNIIDFNNFKVSSGGVMSASGVDISGTIRATGGSISGNLVSSGINASNITSGRLNISDGQGHYLRMGFSEGDNPSVSGLNVGDGGLNMHGHGIVRISRTNVEGIGDGATHSFGIKDYNGGVHYFSFNAGILTSWEYKS